MHILYIIERFEIIPNDPITSREAYLEANAWVKTCVDIDSGSDGFKRMTRTPSEHHYNVPNY